MHEEFEVFLEAHRGRVKEKTYKRYHRNLRQFSEWLEEDSTHPHEVSQRDIKRYITYLNKEQEYAPKTARNKYAPVKLFYKDEILEGNLETNPTQHITHSDVAENRTKKQEETKQARVFLTESEIEQLVQYAPAPQLRNRLIFLFQYHTGLRRQEVADVKLSNLDRETRKVGVVGKHDNEITTYWQPSLDILIDQWIEGGYRDGSTYAENSDYLFLTNSGECISGNYINQLVREAAERAGIQKVLYTDADGNERHKVTSHALRHSFGVHWIKKGGSTAALQQIFAHTDSQTTEIYKDMLDEWVHEEAKEVGVGADLELSPTINQEECGVCGKKANLVTHHLSYEDEETLNVCTKCHHDIHHTDEYTDLQPDMSLEEAKQNGLL